MGKYIKWLTVMVLGIFVILGMLPLGAGSAETEGNAQHTVQCRMEERLHTAIAEEVPGFEGAVLLISACLAAFFQLVRYGAGENYHFAAEKE